MHQEHFQPVTFSIRLILADKAAVKRWADMVGYYLSQYAGELCQGPKVYIGHIKAIAVLSEKEYIKFSKFKCDIPAEVVSAGESSYETLSLTLNSLVYGVTEEDAVKALGRISEKMKKEFLLESTFKLEKAAHGRHEHHQAHDQHEHHHQDHSH